MSSRRLTAEEQGPLPLREPALRHACSREATGVITLPLGPFVPVMYAFVH